MSSVPMGTTSPAKEAADYVNKHHTNDKKYGGGGGGYGHGGRPGYPRHRPGYGYRPRYPRYGGYGGYGGYGRHRRRAPYGWRPRRRYFRGKWWYWMNSRWFGYWPYPYAWPSYGFY